MRTSMPPRSAPERMAISWLAGVPHAPLVPAARLAPASATPSSSRSAATRRAIPTCTRRSQRGGPLLHAGVAGAPSQQLAL